VPEGFFVHEESADYVSDGVVIADGNGKQFVWIPVRSTSDLTRNDSYPGFSPYPNIISCYNVQDWNRTGWSFIDVEYIVGVGGFYVGRFETGYENGKLVVKKGIKPHGAGSMNDALNLAATVYSSNYARTNLITSECWDRVMAFVNGKTTVANTRFNVTTNVSGNPNTQITRCIRL